MKSPDRHKRLLKAVVLGLLIGSPGYAQWTRDGTSTPPLVYPNNGGDNVWVGSPPTLPTGPGAKLTVHGDGDGTGVTFRVQDMNAYSSFTILDNGKIDFNMAGGGNLMTVSGGDVKFTTGAYGAGNGLFWNTLKGALIFGVEPNGGAWNNNEIGMNSFACGAYTRAKALSSIAMGSNVTAAGSYALGAGFHASAMGYGSIAMGNYAEAGRELVSGIVGDYAIALGDYAKAYGDRSVAIGGQTVLADHDNAVAVGHEAYAQGESGYAIGDWVKSTGAGSMTIGSGYGVVPGGGASYMVNSLDYSLGLGVATNEPTLMINTNQVGIGTGMTPPSAKLHIVATADQLKVVQPWNSSICRAMLDAGESHFNLTVGGTTAGSIYQGNFNLGSNMNANILTATPGGNIGLGRSNPVLRLHVVGTPRATGDSIPQGSIMEVRDVTANYSNTTYGGIGLTSAPGYDYSIGKKTVAQTSYFQVRRQDGLELVSVDKDGNTGIGVAVPQEKLDVDGNVQFSDALMPAGDAGTTGQMLVSQGAGTAPVWQDVPTNDNSWLLDGNAGTDPAQNFLGTTDDQAMVVRTSDKKRVWVNADRVDSTVLSGNVGINTESPMAMLDVRGNAVLQDRVQIGNIGKRFIYTPLTDVVSEGMDGSDAALFVPVLKKGQQSDLRLYVLDDAEDRFSVWGNSCADCGNINAASEAFHVTGGGTVYARKGLSIAVDREVGRMVNELEVAGKAVIGYGYTAGSPLPPGHNGVDEQISYAAPANGLLVEGSVGIGVTSVPTGVKLLVEGGSTEIHGGMDVNGLVTVNGNVRASDFIRTGSDSRYKLNVASVGNALDKVRQLDGVYFDYDTATYPEKNFAAGRHIGVIAQNVDTVLHEAVSQDADGYYSVAYEEMIPVLINAIKEQQGMIDGILATNDSLRGRVGDLESSLSSLESRVTVLDGGGSMIRPDGGNESDRFEGRTPWQESMSAPSAVEQSETVSRIRLGQNDPNPFDGTTSISYSVPKGLGNAEMVIVEAATGRIVRTVALGGEESGTVVVAAHDLPSSGLYLYSIRSGGALVGPRKMLRIR